ncbi:hypothetical protein JHK84_051478 [Glycine max]|nr:hypothetical protein JHK84_051478 [Glycine max]
MKSSTIFPIYITVEKGIPRLPPQSNGRYTFWASWQRRGGGGVFAGEFYF